MRLFSTVFSGPEQMSCGGNLRLFFSTEDPNDYDPSKPAIPWKATDSLGIQATLPGGNILNVSLEVNYDGSPQTFFLFATKFSVVSPTGQPIVSVAGVLGQGTIVFVKGQPAITVWQYWSGVLHQNGYISDAGFEMTVPFDGTSADCLGRWWMRWAPAPQS